MKRRKGSFVLSLAVAAVGFANSAFACGCFQSTSYVMSSDQTYVYGTASMSISYLCQGEVTSIVTAPDLSSAWADSGLIDSPPYTTTAQYTIGNQDGTYAGAGTYYYDGSDSGFGTGYFTPQSSNTTVSPFVQLVRTYWSGNISPFANGSARFTVAIRVSNGCSGNVEVEGGMSRPTGAQVYWSDNNLTTEDLSHLFSGGDAFNQDFNAATSVSNSTTGTVTGGGSIKSAPSGCNITGPDAGSGYSATAGTMISN